MALTSMSTGYALVGHLIQNCPTVTNSSDPTTFQVRRIMKAPMAKELTFPFLDDTDMSFMLCVVPSVTSLTKGIRWISAKLEIKN